MAETVTISTFLELKDNMSAGLKQVEAALDRLNKAQQAAGKASGKDAASKAAQARAKATEFAARLEQRRMREAERFAAKEIRDTQKVMAAKTKAADASAKARVAAERRVAREAERAAKAQQRAAEQAKKDRADFIGKAGAAMFGPSVGGIASAYMAGGIKVAGPLAALAAIQGAIAAIQQAATAAYGAVKSFVVKVFELGTQYQDQVRNIAISLRTMDVAPTYAIGVSMAKKYYNTLEALAAKLPGETHDYVQVFTAGVTQALSQGERDLDKFADIASKFTATAINSSIPGGMAQAGRDIDRIMQGRVINTTFMWRKLMPAISQEIGHAITGLEWNKLLPADRLKLFYAAVNRGYKDVEETSHDAVAVVGTLNSLIARIFRVGGQPLFQSSLAIIERINKFLTDNNAKVIQLVSIISGRLGNVLEGAVVKVLDLANNFDSVYEKTASIAASLRDWGTHISPFLWVLNKAAEKMGAMLADFERLGLESEIARVKADRKIHYQKASEAFADPAVQAWLKKAPTTGFERTGLLREETGVTRENIGALTKWAQAGLKSGISREKLAAALSEAPGIQARDEAIAQMLSAPHSVTALGAPAAGRHKTPKAPAGRQTTINDFRFSKFDIRQEFAEGFDPDRIAVAFSSDLAKLGEMRMQSAYAPLYSVSGN